MKQKKQMKPKKKIEICWPLIFNTILLVSIILMTVATAYYVITEGFLKERPTPTPAPWESVTPVPGAEETPAVTEQPDNTPEPTKAAASTELPDETTPDEDTHKHVWVAKKQYSSCEEEEKTWEECECGAIRNEVVTAPAVGHSEELNYEIVIEPDVEKEGFFEERCTYCGQVVNSGALAKLEPTPLPTQEPTAAEAPTETPEPAETPVSTPEPTEVPEPTAAATPEPTEVAAPTAAATPTLTNTPAPTATSTPKPTATPTPKPEPEASLQVAGGITELTFTSDEPKEIVISLSGDNPTMEFNYSVTKNDVIDVTYSEESEEHKAVLVIRPVSNGKVDLNVSVYIDKELTEEEKKEYGRWRILQDYSNITVNVNIPEFITPTPVPTNWDNYSPAEDGYPVFVDSRTDNGITAELWVTEENSRTGVMVFSGEGTVIDSITNGWYVSSYEEYIYYSWHIEKMYFGEGITEIQTCYLPVHYLTDVYFPSTLKVIGKSAFKNAKLTELILPEGLEVLGIDAFYNCYELEQVVLPSTLKSIGTKEKYNTGGGVFALRENSIDNYKNSLSEIRIPKSVEFIGYHAFYNRYNTTLVLEQGIDTSGYKEEWNCHTEGTPLTTIIE